MSFIVVSKLYHIAVYTNKNLYKCRQLHTLFYGNRDGCLHVSHTPRSRAVIEKLNP